GSFVLPPGRPWRSGSSRRDASECRTPGTRIGPARPRRWAQALAQRRSSGRRTRRRTCSRGDWKPRRRDTAPGGVRRTVRRTSRPADSRARIEDNASEQPSGYLSAVRVVKRAPLTHATPLGQNTPTKAGRLRKRARSALTLILLFGYLRLALRLPCSPARAKAQNADGGRYGDRDAGPRITPDSARRE